jgi:hypothetical protein
VIARGDLGRNSSIFEQSQERENRGSVVVDVKVH